jgi:hypothetical protein
MVWNPEGRAPRMKDHLAAQTWPFRNGCHQPISYATIDKGSIELRDRTANSPAVGSVSRTWVTWRLHQLFHRRRSSLYACLFQGQDPVLFFDMPAYMIKKVVHLSSGAR